MTLDFDIYELGIKLEIEFDLEIKPEQRTDVFEHHHAVIEDRYEIDILEVKLGGKLIECSREVKLILEDKIEDFLIENPQ